MLVVVLRLSLVVASRVCCLLQCTGFSTAVASLIVEHGLWVCGFQQLRHTASVFVACRLQGAQASVIMAYRFSCSLVSGIFPDQGLNIGRWTVNYWTTREVLLSLFFSAIYLQEKFDQTFDQICRISYSMFGCRILVVFSLVVLVPFHWEMVFRDHHMGMRDILCY